MNPGLVGGSGCRVLSLFGLAVLAASSVACSVETAGVTGVGVDESGDLVGYIQMCEEHVDGATLYLTDGDSLGEWRASELVTDFARWSLPDPGAWTLEHDYVAPAPNEEYSLYGWTTDDSRSSAHVTFELADLEAMTPGHVLYGDDATGFERATEADFRRYACDDE